MSSGAALMHQDEAERVKSLLAYDVLDTLPDPALDEIARLAASIARAPYAFIGLVDWSRVWFKSRIGFSTRQIPRAGSACEIAVSERRPTLIGDASIDTRFPPGGISLGEDIHCRSYAAAPLIDPSGAVLGILAIASPDPHAFQRSALDAVTVLSRQVMTRLDLYAQGSEREGDLKSRRQAERALTLERNFVSAILDSTSALVVVLDASGRIVRFNRASERASGHTLENLAGLYFPEEIWPREEREAALELFESARDGKPCEAREMLWRTGSGSERRISWSANPLENDRSRVNFVIMTGMDVTDRRLAEENLHAVTRQRESILESVDDGIWGMDLDGRLSFINRRGAEMFGYSREEMLGKNIHDLVHHSREDGSPFPFDQCPITGSLKEGKPIRIHNDVFWKKDGAPLPVEYAACPLMDGSKVRGTVVAFQDATERHRLERMKDEFIATVSHELRTPLTSLRAALGLVAGGTLAQRPEKIPQMIEIAVSNCDRLTRLVNDILDIESIGDDGPPLDKKAWSAVDLLGQTIEAERKEAQRAGLSFRIDAEPVSIYADGNLIVKALRKLVHNAVKFSGAGKEIRLAVRTAADDDVVFAVEDHGCGISRENLQMIFERFRQADASDTRASGGVGLGLAVCRAIVNRHGGRVWAESTPGEGSTFYFTVPRAPESPDNLA